jgi:hypothetical protein
MNHFNRAYEALEERMKVLAEADGDVFLPNPKPAGPVEYVFVCMEPSLGRWARSKAEANSKVLAGSKNFLSSIEDFILHYSARNYLCGSAQNYYITDLSKGAMLVEHAGLKRTERYDLWYSLLIDELDLVSTDTAVVIAVGGQVAKQLARRGFERPLARILHYSGQAAKARKEATKGREQEFELFKTTISHRQLVTVAALVLERSGIPAGIQYETFLRLSKSQLTESRLRLMFIYKSTFDRLKRE